MTNQSLLFFNQIDSEKKESLLIILTNFFRMAKNSRKWDVKPLTNHKFNNLILTEKILVHRDRQQFGWIKKSFFLLFLFTISFLLLMFLVILFFNRYSARIFSWIFRNVILTFKKVSIFFVFYFIALNTYVTILECYE